MSLRWAQPWLPWVVPTFGRKPCSFFNACQHVVGMWSVTVLPWQQQPLGSSGNWLSFGLWRWRSSTEVVLLPMLWSKIMSSILPIIAMQFVSWVCCHIGWRVRIKQSFGTILQHQNRMVFFQISLTVIEREEHTACAQSHHLQCSHQRLWGPTLGTCPSFVRNNDHCEGGRTLGCGWSPREGLTSSMKTPESALTLQVTPDIISYSSCIAACGQGQRWSDAMNLLDEMKQLQLQRNIIALRMHMAGVQNSRSKGSYKVGPIGIAKLILNLRYEAGPIGNHAVPKLGASIALAWR